MIRTYTPLSLAFAYSLSLGLPAVVAHAAPWCERPMDRDELPMELISFTAVEVGDHVQLDWSTATESNNIGFVVERSTNGISFSGIVSVAAAGNSQQITHYQTLDRQPPSGTKYYRIRQNDADGGVSYSPIVEIQGITGVTVVSPNPCTTDLFTISGAAVGSRLEIRTSAGQPVRTMTLTSDVVNHQGLPPGVYLLRLIDPTTGTVRSMQLVKE